MRVHVSLKEQLKDDVCKSILTLGGLAYAALFGVIILIYPYQMTDDGLNNDPIVWGIVLSFVLLGIIFYYACKLYDRRLYQLRVIKSRKKFRAEMRELRNELEKIQQADNTEKEE